MGLFKQMKDMKNVVAAAPEMINQAQALGAQAQQLAAAQQMAAAQGVGVAGAAGMPGAGGVLDEATLAPIAGVSLERYAAISKGIATRGLDRAGCDAFVQTQGISPADYQAMCDGWADRFKGNTALAVHFGNLYQAAAAL